MTPIETFLIAGPMVTGIAAFGLEWYQRQNKTFRMRRSLQGYTVKVLAEEPATEQETFTLWTLKAA